MYIDDFGNALINRYMADKGISTSQITSLDRLAYMFAVAERFGLGEVKLVLKKVREVIKSWPI